jgi:hypothetical protein
MLLCHVRFQNYFLCHHFGTDFPHCFPAFQLDLRPCIYDTIDIMKKVWVYKRKNIKGYWVGWYEGGMRKAKALPTRKLAEHFFTN